VRYQFFLHYITDQGVEGEGYREGVYHPQPTIGSGGVL